jgi:hypothetical protein
MILRHLRTNLVAYLALLVALTTGTAYAAGLAPGSVTGKAIAKDAVTSPKIKKNAVKSADVKDGSITATDLAAGTVPLTFVGTLMSAAETPTATPEQGGLDPYVVSLPAAGKVYVRFFSANSGITCSSGNGNYGMYVDGAPIPLGGTFAPAFANALPVTLTATVNLAAGGHVFTFANDCPAGGISQSTRANTGWTVLTLGK